MPFSPASSPTAMPAARRPVFLDLLPTLLPLLVGVGFTGGYVTERNSPYDTSVLVVFAVAMLAAGGIPRVRLLAASSEAVVLLAGAWLLWMAGVQLLVPAAAACGWWHFGDYAAGLLLCLKVATARAGARAQLVHLGAAVACGVGLAAVVGWANHLLRPLETLCFGYGNLNILVSIAGPTLIAWGVLVASAWRGGERPRWPALALLVTGAGLLVAMAAITGRRGGALALVAALAWLAIRWAWPRARRAVLATLALAAIAAVVLAVRLASLDIGTGRLERIDLYRAGWETARAGAPAGLGFYGALHIQDVPGESARHLTAAGGRSGHIHDEPLDALINGGPVALLLELALLGIVAWRLTRLRDRGLRLALEAGLAAAAVHLLTDNSYGTTLGIAWCGMMAGLALRPALAAPAPRPAPRRLLPTVRWVAWPLFLVVAWAVTRGFYSGVLADDASTEVRFRCLQQTLSPESVDLQLYRLLLDDPGQLSHRDQDLVITTAVAKLGWTGPLAGAKARLAYAGGDDRDRATALLRLLRLSPFDRNCSRRLQALLTADPACAPLVPVEFQRRAAYVDGDPRLPAPDLTVAPLTIDDAADLFAALQWAALRGRPAAELRPGIGALAQRYGNVPDVAAWIFARIGAADPHAFPEAERCAPALALGLRLVSGEAAETLERAAAGGDAGAEALRPLASAIWAPLLAEFEGRTMHLEADASDVEIRQRNAMVRLWARWRARPAAGAGP